MGLYERIKKKLLGTKVPVADCISSAIQEPVEEICSLTYRAKAAGQGYEPDDILIHISAVHRSTSPWTVKSHTWFNVTQARILHTVPDADTIALSITGASTVVPLVVSPADVVKQIKETVENIIQNWIKSLPGGGLGYFNQTSSEERTAFLRQAYDAKYQAVQEFYWQFSYGLVYDECFNESSSLQRMVKDLTDGQNHYLEVLASKACKELVEAVNEAGGDPQAFRLLSQCHQTIQQLKKCAQELEQQNLRLLTQSQTEK